MLHPELYKKDQNKEETDKDKGPEKEGQEKQEDKDSKGKEEERKFKEPKNRNGRGRRVRIIRCGISEVLFQIMSLIHYGNNKGMRLLQMETTR